LNRSGRAGGGSRPLLQLALDQLDLQAAVAVAELTRDYIDIFEVGTPCLKVNGLEAIRQLRVVAAGKPVLADLKTMDAGEYESEPFYRCGASICTVLGVASMATIQGVVSAAQRHAAQAQVDLIQVANKVQVAEQICTLGIDILGIHTGIDGQLQGETPFDDLRAIANLGLTCKISVAGGLGPDTVRRAADLGADIVVIGARISAAPDPLAAARSIHAALG